MNGFDMSEYDRQLRETMSMGTNINLQKLEIAEKTLNIQQEILEMDKLKIRLLESFTGEQKEIVKKIDSLIDIVSFNGKVQEANISIIEQEILDLKKSTDNLNDGFVNIIQDKLAEKGVEVALAYFFVGLKTFFIGS